MIDTDFVDQQIDTARGKLLCKWQKTTLISEKHLALPTGYLPGSRRI